MNEFDYFSVQMNGLCTNDFIRFFDLDETGHVYEEALITPSVPSMDGIDKQEEDDLYMTSSTATSSSPRAQGTLTPWTRRTTHDDEHA